MKLGVNIDHVATLRQARQGQQPDVLLLAKEALAGGADGITVHLREDRRHIQDKDVRHLRALDGVILNLEMAATEEMISIAQQIKPDYCCLVPEKRQELTTEGGLDVVSQQEPLQQACQTLRNSGIKVSLFIDPDQQQIQAAHAVGADLIEIHTGEYALQKGSASELERIKTGAKFAHSLGLMVNAGHGLDLDNVQAIAAIPEIHELNIGHSIVARALMVGMQAAVSEMKAAIDGA